MKKLLLYMLIVIFSFSALSCSQKKSNESTKEDFSIEKAEKLVKEYMNYVVKGDVSKLKGFYSKDIKNQSLAQNSNLKVVGYNIEDISEVGVKGILKVKVNRIDNNGSYCSLDEYTLEVVNEDESYKISEITSSNFKEASLEQNQIRTRIKDKTKAYLICNLYDMPTYAFSTEDKAKINKIQVSKDSFGLINFNYDGDKIAISTKGKNSLLSVVDIDESLDNEESNSASSSGSDSSQKPVSATEKAIGKTINILDIYENSKVNNLIFSQDKKFLATEYSDNMGSKIRLYNIESNKPVLINLEKKFPMDKVNLQLIEFDKEDLTFSVTAKSGYQKIKEVQDTIGLWKLNTSDIKIKKI